jgi:hypothetical protein
VRPHRALLVDDAEADAGEAPVEVLEERGERRAVRFHLAAMRGVLGERRGQDDLQSASAASTE